MACDLAQPCTLVSRLALSNGQIVFRKLHAGSREECDIVADATPALAWSGSVKVHHAELITMPAADWLEIAGGHDVVSYAAPAAEPTP